LIEHLNIEINLFKYFSEHNSFWHKAFSLCFFLIFNTHLSAALEDYYPYPVNPTSTNYGETGLIEMPTARFMEEGTIKIGITASYPNEFTYLAASPFSWFEAVYRYAEQKNLKYGPAHYSGQQTLKDKGFDIKFKILKESDYLPQIAVGLRDVAGTGRFAGEYLVASKEIGPVDFSLGLGWGALGIDQNIRNPFISLGESFSERTRAAKKGGSFNTNYWFSGRRAAIYGGLEYKLYKFGLNLKLEYDTTNPDLGFYGPPLEVKSRFNFGVFRSFNEFIDLGLSYERGTEVRFSFTFKGNYSKNLVPKLDPPKKVYPLSDEQKVQISKNKDLFYRSLNRSLKEESIFIQGASYNNDSVDIVFNQVRFRSFPRAVGRTARIVSALTPDEVEEINVYLMNGDIEISSVSLHKDEFDKSIENRSTSSEVLFKSKINPPGNRPQYKKTEFKPTVRYPEFFWSVSPALRHQIGGPEAFYLGQLWGKIDTTLIFQRGLSLSTVLGFDIYNNFNELNNASKSDIPHVRSDIQEYLKEGETNIARMQLSYIWSPYRDLFARVDLGLFEEMFGGFGGEIYYRPFTSKFSTTISYHHVKQRGFKQRFKFRDYRTETGHLGLHYDLPKGVHAQVSIGKYLAGDKGASLDLSRRFKTGFTLGVYATKTNLSVEEFGEGSFDKGFYFSIPTDMFYPTYRTGSIAFGLSPLTKDGGATLRVHNGLFSLFGDTNKSSFLRDWDDLLY